MTGQEHQQSDMNLLFPIAKPTDDADKAWHADKDAVAGNAEQQGGQGLLGNVGGASADGGSQEMEAGYLGMFHNSRIQAASALHHIGEIHQRPVCETQCQIQIPQTDITVQTENAVTAERQGGAYTGHKGGLTGTAFAGYHGDALSSGSHTASLPHFCPMCSQFTIITDSS